MAVRLGPAGVPLSCKGRTIVEGMDDIISLGMDAMEIQTVRMVAPNHFEQYWQAGALSYKADFELNIHGPYYSEILGNKMQLNRTLAKLEATLQAGKVLNARHITCHVGPYLGHSRGSEANEVVANVFAGVVDRIAEIWEEDADHPVFPWLSETTPTKIGIETSGRQNLWGSIEEVLEVVNHVENTVPVINFAHIHSRGHGRLKTSEDYGELFDLVRETIGTKEFYCHFSGVEHLMGNALHYTQIKKSDLNFEPLAEFLVEEGDWLDVTIISDSPLLEHDAMYMSQLISKSRHRQLERKAREQRRRELALKSGMSPEELEIREKEAAEKRKNAEANAPIQMFDEIDIDPRKILDTKTVAQLKELCKEKELPVSGKKNDIIQRLYVKMMEEKEIQKRIDAYELKTVAQLKDMLRELNVPVSGTKPELISKLMVAEDEIAEALENQEESSENDGKVSESKENDDDLFSDEDDDDLF
ncbi:MAG: hypothetical protein CMA03_06345 [Euryarchaeota archaeon]|nr:hypothetical protein [Euryarchaeota archaeon]